MIRYIVLRVLVMIPMLLLVLTIVFFLGKLAPGDPLELMYASPELELSKLSPEQRAEMRKRYGLDKPLVVQYADYVTNVFQGNLGVSITRNRDVLPMILRVFPISGQMGLLAVVLLVSIGVPLGILAALKQNSTVDYLIVGGSLFVNTIPIYVLAPLSMILLVLQLKLMPVPYGWEGLFSQNVLLPVFLLMLGPLAGIVRQMRASILEVLSNDYVRTARAKGLPEKRVVVGHILRNALTPMVTIFGFLVSGMIQGSLFLDIIFGIPGFGNLAWTALQQRDYPTIFGCTLFSTFIVMTSNLMADLLYPVVDPRVRR